MWREDSVNIDPEKIKDDELRKAYEKGDGSEVYHGCGMGTELLHLQHLRGAGWYE